jgi:hypothetical protein
VLPISRRALGCRYIPNVEDIVYGPKDATLPPVTRLLEHGDLEQEQGVATRAWRDGKMPEVRVRRMTITETFQGHKLFSLSTARTRKVVIVGSASVVVPTGQTRRVRIPLNSTGKHLLSSRRKLRVSLVVTQSVGAASKVVSRQKLTLKASKG